MRKLMFVLVILGLAATADASWKWTGYAGDNLWSSNNNWDNLTPPPSNEAWVVNKLGFPIANHVIVVNQNASTQSGDFYTQAGYKCSLTIQSGVTMNMGSFGNDGVYHTGDAVDVVVQSGANWNVNVGDATLNVGSNENVSIYGTLLTDYIYVNNSNAVLDIYNYAETWLVSRVATDPGCAINVYDDAILKVTCSTAPTAYPGYWDKKKGQASLMIGGTALIHWDCDGAYAGAGGYLGYVKAGEAGGYFEADYDVTTPGYTTIKYLPEPASLMLLVMGSVALIRRR